MRDAQEIKACVSNVNSDIEFIRNDWNQEIDDHSLRRSSVILRRLLVEKEYGRAWRGIGYQKEPGIEAPDLIKFLGDIDHKKVRLALIGGATYKGAYTKAVAEFNYALTPEEIKAFNGNISGNETYTLSTFLESPCIIIDGQIINRREVIKYVAYALGGVHPVSRKRDKRKKEDSVFKLLDNICETYKITEKNCIYFELLSIGQRLASSKDTLTFLQSSEIFLSNKP